MGRRGFMLVVACLLQCALSRADSSSGGFIYPGNSGPDRSIPWQVGEFRPLQWFSTLDDYNVTLWQQNPPSLVGTVWSTTDGNGAGDKSFSWQVQTYTANTETSSRYTLWVGYEIYHNASSGFVSYSFNITDKAVASTTTSASTTGTASATSSSTSTATATPTAAATANQTTSDSSSSTSQASSHDNETLKVGLGVGLGVGIPIIFALGFGLAWLIRRRNKPGEGYTGPEYAKAPSSAGDGFASPMSKAPPVYESPRPTPMAEVESNPMAEIPSNQRPVELESTRHTSELE